MVAERLEPGRGEHVRAPGSGGAGLRVQRVGRPRPRRHQGDRPRRGQPLAVDGPLVAVSAIEQVDELQRPWDGSLALAGLALDDRPRLGHGGGADHPARSPWVAAPLAEESLALPLDHPGRLTARHLVAERRGAEHLLHDGEHLARRRCHDEAPRVGAGSEFPSHGARL